MVLRAVRTMLGISLALIIIRISVSKTFEKSLPERIKIDEIAKLVNASNEKYPPRLRWEGHSSTSGEFQNSTSKFINENSYKKLRRKRKLQNTRIIGGGKALKNRYPYMASLTYERAHTCGGSLIADDIILSAAHCWENFDGVDLGRHNVKDPDEDYERFNIEKFVTHPGYVDKNKPGAAFNNDFMIIKLYGWSKKATLQVNTDPAMPKANKELTVMGWGVADNTNKLPSEFLKEVTVNAMSNNQCRTRNGYIGGKKVSLLGRITNNMMCAQDKNEDACQGDSGGPLIEKGLLPRLDKQVGVVSWGMGCAHEVFPGVYARISSQMSWIKKTVCNWAESPPDDFGCDKSDRDDEKNDDEKLDKRAVTVDIMLDRFPKETGWLIRTKMGKSIAYIPIGGYKNVKESEKHIFATVHLKINQEYEFIMLDSYGDGLQYDGGKYKLWLGDTPYMGKLMAEGATFGRSIHHPFTVPKEEEPRPAPKPTPPANKQPTAPILPQQPSPVGFGFPSIANTPTKNDDEVISTPPPSQNTIHITIAIKLDNYPEEVGWAISSAKNEVIASKPIGYYKRKNKLIIEKVRIPEQYLLSSDNVMFALLDNGQDGLCCDKGQGLFQVFIGDIGDENLVVKGSKFQRLQHFDINLFQQSSSASSKSFNTSTISESDKTSPSSLTSRSSSKLDEPTDEPTNASNRALASKLILLLCIIYSIAIILR